MKPRELPMPTTYEAFVALQRQLTPWPLTDEQTDIFHPVVEIINASYSFGCDGEELPEAFRAYQTKEHPFMKSLYAWISLAYARGIEQGRKNAV